MDNVICDICGSAYSESDEQCPVCGSSREYAKYPSSGGMPKYIPAGRKKGMFFDTEDFYDFEEPLEESSQAPSFSQDGQQEHPRHNLFAVIGLTILISLLLLGSGFLFFRYYLPNHILIPTETVTEPTEVTQTEEVTTEEPTVPCRSIALTAGIPEINRIGQYWLMHVIVTPEDTTDSLVFVSADESIVTVTEEGRLCSVGEGQTSVIISCGSIEIICPVTVRIPETEETTASEENTEEASAQTEPEALTVDEPTASTEPEETTDPRETDTAAVQEEGIVLRLKDSDLTFTTRGKQFQLELDCDLKPEEVTWFVMNSNVVICHDGLITVTGHGTTRVVAQYGDQQVECIIRCNLK